MLFGGTPTPPLRETAPAEKRSDRGRLRVVIFDGVAQGCLAPAPDLEVVSCPDLVVLSGLSKGAAPTLLIVDLGVLEAPKRVELVQRIERQHAFLALAVVDIIEPSNCERLLRSGFAGILPRDSSPDTFERAVRSIAEGQLWFPREVSSQVLKGFLVEQNFRHLTTREAEILKLIRLGRNNRQIADELFISRETVRWHVRGLNAKLGAEDRNGSGEYLRSLRRKGNANSKDSGVSANPQKQSIAS